MSGDVVMNSIEPSEWPLILHPLFHPSNKDINSVNACHTHTKKVIHSIVTDIPLGARNDYFESMNLQFNGEIQTNIEEYYENDEMLFRRVAVKSYGDVSDGDGSLFASYMLPSDPFTHGHNIMCYTHFDGKPHLCILSAPTKISIFDVFPSSNDKDVISGGEGHIVSLPFEANSIFSLPHSSCGGLLIQRQSNDGNVPMQLNYTEEVLKQLENASSLGHQNMINSKIKEGTYGIGALKNQSRPSLDGELSMHSSYSDESDINQLVTNHNATTLPTLYTLHLPLDEIRPCLVISDKGFNAENKNELWCKDTTYFSNEEEEVLFVGCIRCFTKSISDVVTVTYNHKKGFHRIWMLNETPTPPAPMPLWKSSSLNPDIDIASASAFSELYSKVAMRCIYTIQNNGVNGAASKIFLSTNEKSTGDFVLSLLQQGNSDESKHKLVSVEFDPIHQHMSKSMYWNIVNEFSHVCVSAVPIKSSPILFSPFSINKMENEESQKNRLQWNSGIKPKATDILLSKADGNLMLYRGNTLLTYVCFPSNISFPSSTSYKLGNPVTNRFDVSCEDSNFEFYMRFSCSIYCAQSEVAETALSAIGSAFLTTEDECSQIPFALRADCLRLAQLRARSDVQSTDVEWESFQIITSAVIAVENGFDLASEMDKITVADTRNIDNPWGELLRSKFYNEFIASDARLALGEDSEVKVDDEEGNLFHSNEEVQFIKNSRSIAILKSIGLSKGISNIIFDALHCICEDLKVRRGSNSEDTSRKLSQFLLSIAKRCNTGTNSFMADYVKHYTLNFPQSRTSCDFFGYFELNIQSRISNWSEPFCIFLWIEHIMENHNEGIYNTYLNGECNTAGKLLQLYKVLFSNSRKSNREKRDSELVHSLVNQGFKDVNDLCSKISLLLLVPILDAVARSRLNPPIMATISPSFYRFIGRIDLAKIKEHGGINTAVDNPAITSSFDTKGDDKDGLVSIEKFSAMLFPNDVRIRDAAKLLRSSKPQFLRVTRGPETNDHDYEKLKQQKLALLCRRVLALPLGRGMMTIGTCELPFEPLTIPEICLAGRIPPQNAILALEESRCTGKHKLWPEFHNGVASGLRLPQARDEKSRLSRNWIVSNKPKVRPVAPVQAGQPPPEIEHDHAFGGFLFALGLRGHLQSLDKPDIFDYINNGANTTVVGLLLGLSANKIGSCDANILRTLCIHIPSLFPTSLRPVELCTSIQTAAITGAGLLCIGSYHRILTEFLLNEIGKRPSADQNTDDREGYNLCCGLALGMINICLGNRGRSSMNDDLSDLKIEERLHRYIAGGIDENFEKQKQHQVDRSQNTENNENERSSKIYEGPMINIDITSPGSTLALGMIYHRSGSEAAVSLLELPQTLYELDSVRPDFLFFRLVAKSLILWERIEPSKTWMNSQMPEIISKYYELFRLKTNEASSFEGLTLFSLSKQGKDDQGKEDGGDIQMEKELKNAKLEEFSSDLDYNSIRQSHAYITAGICFSLGLRFAGTGNEEACSSIFEKILELQKLRDGNDSLSLALRPDIPTLELCLGSAAIALAMVMSGTGDLKVFRLLKSLRWKSEMDVKYGNHMAYASAIGLLFLGGGSKTLGNEPRDIACLLISFFPRFPIFTHDNRYHLQALRHLYALAAKDRKIEAIDVDSNEKILLPLKIKFCNGHEDKVMSPTILLHKAETCEVSIDSDSYYPAQMEVNGLHELNAITSIFVKRKVGRLSHAQDPSGNSLNISHIDLTRDDSLSLMRSVSSDRQSKAFYKYFCGSTSCGSDIFSLHESTCQSFSTKLVVEAFTQEEKDSMIIYFALWTLVVNIQSNAWQSKSMWELRLLRTFFQVSDTFEVISPYFASLVCESIDNAISIQVKGVGDDSRAFHTNSIEIWNTRLGCNSS